MTISSHAAAAKAIRTELKDHNVQARVTSSSASMTTSVDVYLTDLPPHTIKAIKEFAEPYGYENHGYSRNGTPQARFVFINLVFSDSLRQAAWTELRARLEGMDQYPAEVDRATDAYDVCNQLHKYLTGFQSDFIYSGFAKPRIGAN